MSKSWWWLAVFIVVGVLLGAGVILLVTRQPRGEPIALLPAPTPAPITVYVSGSVNHPGLYALPFGSRVNDAIQAAGGFGENADTGAINLAEILTDGGQVNVPEIMQNQANHGGTGSMPRSNLLVDINTASLEELDTLPQIGPITAQSIIDYRVANGPFNSIAGLLEVDGIGQVTFDEIKNLITVGTSP